jgi:hypothetical protein
MNLDPRLDITLLYYHWVAASAAMKPLVWSLLGS